MFDSETDWLRIMLPTRTFGSMSESYNSLQLLARFVQFIEKINDSWREQLFWHAGIYILEPCTAKSQ
jgi:hypothetical protein